MINFEEEEKVKPKYKCGRKRSQTWKYNPSQFPESREQFKSFIQYDGECGENVSWPFIKENLGKKCQ